MASLNLSREEQWNRLIDTRLSKAKMNYDKVITYYSKLRQSFINDLCKASNLNASEIGQAISEYLFKPLRSKDNGYNANQARDISVKIFTKVMEEMKEGLKNANTNTLKNTYNKMIKAKDDTKKVAEKAYQEEVEKIMNEIYDEDTTIRDLKQILLTSFPGDHMNEYDTKQFMEKITLYKSLLLRFIAQGGSPDSFYVDRNKLTVIRTAGYVMEVATYDAMSKLCNYFSNITKQINIRAEAIGADNEHLDELFKIDIPNTTLEGKATIETKSYGIQSKSFTLPGEFANKKTKYDYNLSHNANLLKGLINANGEHSWSQGVEYLSEYNNAIEATDNAVLWKTGHDFIWADKFMRDMAKNDYFIAFKFESNKWIATDQIQWRKRRRLLYKDNRQ